MASRKDEKERLRQARVEAEKADLAADRKRLLLGYVVAAVLSLAVVAGIVIVILGGDGDSGSSGNDEFSFYNPQSGENAGVAFDNRSDWTDPPAAAGSNLEVAAKAAECDLELTLKDEGNGHFEDEDREAKWQTAPPTSGDHYGSGFEVFSGAQADAAYSETPPIARVLHSLEHGRIAIQYKPSLAEEDQLKLKGLIAADPSAMLLFPNDDMPYEVAATGWRNLIGCKRFDGDRTIEALRIFRDSFRGPVGLAPEA